MPRVVYHYDLGEWETPEKALGKDRAIYVAAGLPLEFDRLHWLMCGLEGALLLSSNMLASRGVAQRDEMAGMWIAPDIFGKFARHNREFGYGESATGAAALKLKEKLFSQGQIGLSELLMDVCDVIETADKAGAERYFAFWSTV